jgi:hypothetical protein
MNGAQSVTANESQEPAPATSGPLTANYRFFGALDINLFAISETGDLLQVLLTNSPSKPYFSNLGATQLGGGLVGAIAAVQGGDMCYFFALADNNNLLAQRWGGQDWSGWWEIGAAAPELGSLTSAIAAVNIGDSSAQLYAITEIAGLACYDISSSQWFDLGMCSIGGGLGAAVAASASANGAIAVVCSTVSGSLVLRQYDNGGWSDWLEVTPPSDLEIQSVTAAYVQTMLHIAATDQNGMIWYANSADGHSFSPWQVITSPSQPVMPGSTLGSVAYAENYDHQLDLFSISQSDGELLWCWCTESSGWSAWTSFGVWPS